MKTNITKGITLVAVGFLFTLVNINLTINTLKVNITPDFIGWFLFFLAFDNLGEYGKGKEYIKWLSLILTIAVAALWILGIVRPDIKIDLYKTIVSVLSAIYIFILFGMLSKIAEYYGSSKASTINFLKYLNIILILLFAGVAYYGAYKQSTALLGTAAIFGIMALVSAIVTCVTLFGLRKDIRNSVSTESAE
ncbi:MAG: hypothetical protein IKE38_05390 [Erysipelotrichaceae bacterium]|nr:hypothetical protein [Erysipelotrichaceae bacterium]